MIMNFLSPSGRLALVVATAHLLAGVGLMSVWEHRSPWGLEAKRAAAVLTVEAPITGWRARLAKTEGQRDHWFNLYAACENARAGQQTEAAGAVSRASEKQAAASSAAFTQGYTAGRAVGLQRCGGNLAPEVSPDPVGVPGPGGLRDGETELSALFGLGSYVP